MDSSSGVMLGRKCSAGKTASSKTLARPVLRSTLSGNLMRKSLRMARPRARTLVAPSSTSVRRTGMKSGHCLLMRSSCASERVSCDRGAAERRSGMESLPWPPGRPTGRRLVPCDLRTSTA